MHHYVYFFLLKLYDYENPKNNKTTFNMITLIQVKCYWQLLTLKNNTPDNPSHFVYFGHALFQFFLGTGGRDFHQSLYIFWGILKAWTSRHFPILKILLRLALTLNWAELEINLRNVMFSTGQLITYDFVNPPFKTKHLKCLVSRYIWTRVTWKIAI